MTKINLRVLRSLLTIKWRAFAVVATIAVGVGMCGGIFQGIESIFYTQDVIVERNNFADLDVTFVPEDVANLPDLTQIPGVDRVERRLIFPGTTKLKDGRPLPTVVVFLESGQPGVDSLTLQEGTTFANDDFDGVVLERGLRTFHNYHSGDTISVDVGERHYDFVARGVAFSPEYVTASTNPDFFVPEKGGLAVVFANIAKVSDALGFKMVNNLLFAFKPGVNASAVKKDIMTGLGRISVERVTTGTDHFSYKFVRTDLTTMRRFLPALVLVLEALTFLLTLLTFNRLVIAERREIGVLLAIGHSRGPILRSYMLAGCAVGVVGCAFGLVIAYGLRGVYAMIYTQAAGLPPIILRTYPGILIASVALGLFATVTSAVLPGLRLLYFGGRSAVPQEIIRDPQRRSPSDGRIVRYLFAWLARGSIGWRYGVRNLVRRSGLTLSMIAAMGFALAVPISYWISTDSIRGTVEATFNREKWELAVDFLYPVYPDEAAQLTKDTPNVKAEPYVRASGELWHGDAFLFTGLLGIKPEGTMKAMPVFRGRPIRGGGADEIVVSKDLAQKLNLDVGENVAIRVRQKSFSFRVVGIVSDTMLSQSIVHIDALRSMVEYQDKATGLYLGGIANSGVTRASLTAHEFVGNVTNRQQIADAFLAILDEVLKLVWMSAVISIFVALLFLFTSLNITVSEQEREYATLKALGYGKRSLTSIILTESWIQAIIAVVISIPIGIAIARFLTIRAGQSWFFVDLNLKWSSVAMIVVPALLLIPVFARPAIISIINLPIPKALSTKLME